MVSIRATWLIIAAALAGCGDSEKIVSRQLPPEPNPPPTGPVHVVVGDMVDVWIPADKQFARMFFNTTGTIPLASLGVTTRDEYDIGAGISVAYEPQSADAEVDETSIVHATVVVGPKHAELDSHSFSRLSAAFSSGGVDLKGSIEIDGVEHSVSVQGPLYRYCAYLGAPKPREPSSSCDGDACSSEEPEPGSVDVYYEDADFLDPACAPFK